MLFKLKNIAHKLKIITKTSKIRPRVKVIRCSYVTDNDQVQHLSQERVEARAIEYLAKIGHNKEAAKVIMNL
jgi:hypothetical protein